MPGPTPEERLSTLVDAIAQALGREWRPRTSVISHSLRELIHPDGRHLYLRFQDWARMDRVKISGHFPASTHGMPCGVQAPSISVAVNRGAPAIAREINRRLMPTYTAALERVRVFHAERAHQDARRGQLAQQICAILPGTIRTAPRWAPERPTNTTLSWIGRGAGCSSATFTLDHGADVVDLELHRIPRDIAVQICCAIAAAEERKAAPEGAPIAS